MSNTLLDRFLRYVAIDTQSDEASSSFPSTEKQKNLGRLLVAELQELGITDAHLDDWGYVYATIPATSGEPAPVVCFCSHMDTSPDASGAGVKPIVHRNYQGQDLVLPDDRSVVIRPSDHPDLLEQIGNDVITASGMTLLGADNKAGIAAIMDAAQRLTQNPGIPHGMIKVLFTPDEEIGQGVKHVDLKKLGADYAYTIDGERAGGLQDETFSADQVEVTIHGVSAHPGMAKGKLENASKIAGEILTSLPKDRLSPESTCGRLGFIHPTRMEGIAEQARLQFIIRDFDTAMLAKHEQELRSIIDSVMQRYPASSYDFVVTEQYRNMKEVLIHHPQVIAIAERAIQDAGLSLHKEAIRGGTDGSRLSFMGLPCPNIFTGGHGFHSRQEWVSLQDMEKAAEVIVRIAKYWAER
jgi:tripeptide aminopeptidase